MVNPTAGRNSRISYSAGFSRFLSGFTLVLIAVFLSPMAAHAAGTIQVSDDGVTWGAAYPGVLFDGIAKIVPGDTQSETFYLRNSGPDDGYLRITARDVSGTAVLLQNLSAAASVPAKPGSPVNLSVVAPCWVLNEGIFLAAGSTVAVTANLNFDFSATNITQDATATFNIGVSLTDTAVALPPTDCGGSVTVIPGTVPQPGALGSTGAEVPVMLISVTAFIVGAGLFLIVAARRRKREHDGKARST